MNDYIKLNNNDNHLSLGNLFNIIKNISINKSSAIQTEIFCILFNIDSISETTVNNYCTGYRSINHEYKQIYLNYKKKYFTDKTIMLDIINNLLSIIDGYIYNFENISSINNLDSLKFLCHKLHKLAKNDIYVTNKFKKDILNHLNKHKYYEALSEMLFFIILDKKQPIYSSEEINETIEEIIKNTNLGINDLKKYLNIKFKEGISFIPSLKKLAEENNPYAYHELGNLEYTGQIKGYPDYEKAYYYHKIAASFNHPTSYWMLSHMILNKKIGSLNDEDINLSWEYLKKAESLDSISAINTLGICYLYGYNPKKIIDNNKAILYFEKAAKKNYIYAYNNLGKIYEEKKDYQKAFEYFLKSADQEESWACNKIGEYYRQGIYIKPNLEKAFKYYSLGLNTPITNRCPWNAYNLVKYFYMEGNSTIGIKKDIDKSISLLENNYNLNHNFKVLNSELLLYLYYEKYLTSRNQEYLNKVNYYLNILNNSDIFDIKKKQSIEDHLKNIQEYTITIP